MMEQITSDKPVRVLQVVTHMNRGGLETMLMNYYREIDRSKVQFDFLTHRSDGEKDYDAEILALGGKIYHLPPLNPFSLTYRKELDRFFAEHPEYHIVHSHLDCMSSIPLHAAKKHGVPVRLAHAHNTSQDKDLKYPLKLYYRRKIHAEATGLLACGEDAGKWMFPECSFQVLNNAIKTSLYRYTEERACAESKKLGLTGKFVIGHVGSLRTAKNHKFLIEIFAAIARKRQDAFLLLVGEGSLRTELEEQVRALKLQDSVRFMGLRADVADLMQAMDVFVFPSLYEGLPVTMVEAQAAGLPCFISDAVPVQCIMTNNVWQLPLSSTADAWAEKILKEYADLERRDTSAEIKNAGFDIVENAKWLQNFYLDFR